MKPSLLRPTAALALLVAFSGCTKTEPAPQPQAKAETRHADNVVVLTKENLSHVKIQTEPVSRGSLSLTLRAMARIDDNLNKTAKVTSTLEGRLTQLNADLNAPVKAGDVLALVQTPELLGKPLELRAPIDGRIVERHRTVGELISKDTPVYTISDPTDLWVLAEIKERDIGVVRVGQEATFTVLAYPAESFQGKVVLIGNRVEAESRTLEIRIEVNNADGRLKPGMFADVEIATHVLEDVLVISGQAIQTMDDEQVVFVATSESRFEKRVVTPGLEQHGRVEIRAGVTAGERVVTVGSFILKSEMLKGELGEE
ncbi:MAG: efflux RND transporter periplasmic adaptor subunit [Opitutaceae bacterium]